MKGRLTVERSTITTGDTLPSPFGELSIPLYGQSGAITLRDVDASGYNIGVYGAGTTVRVLSSTVTVRSTGGTADFASYGSTQLVGVIILAGTIDPGATCSGVIAAGVALDNTCSP